MNTVFYVVATVREKSCDRKSPIIELQLDTSYNGGTIHPLVELVELASKHLLWVNLGRGTKPERVEVYWSDYYHRYIARTVADTQLVNNLDRLPIVKPKVYQTTPGITRYEHCSL